MEIWLTKTPNGIYPADEESAEKFNSAPQGMFKAKLVAHRNYENHKRFFAFIKQTFDMQEHFESEEHYRKWLIMKAGHYDAIVAPNGYTIFQAKSISFDEMEEPEFKKMFSECINVFLRELGKGMTEEDLMKVVDFG